MEPEVYKSIEGKLKSTKDARNRFIRKFVQPIKETLTKEGYNYQVKVRTKSISSIWRKMKNKGVPFEEVYDVFRNSNHP
jgi:guanosine-3',5'-bis(diphosphate) 3'-pyrophosphohydrolase